jgi:fumarate reductase subunit C
LMSDEPKNWGGKGRVACFLASLAIVVGVFTFNRNTMTKGRASWTESFLDFAANPLRIIVALAVAALLTWALGRLRIRRWNDDMSERLSVSARGRIVALIAFTLLAGAFAAWLRFSGRDDVWGKDLNYSVPVIPNQNNEPPLLEAEAAKIAIAEIKAREGWTGKFTHAEREGFRWYIIVRHEPNVPHDYRVVEVHGTDGKVLDVGVLKTDAP